MENERSVDGLSPLELATRIGVRKQRVHKLFTEGRIPGARKLDDGRIVIPPEPEIKRGQRSRPGPVTEYMDFWESDNDVRSA